jgi:hypothetical protein
MVPGVRRAEGDGQNPRSSAAGLFQFTDPTFIDQFRRNFPDQARGRSNQEILALRGTTLPDGRLVEQVLGPAYMQQNAQALTRGGFAATGQNVYLAHHFGATGAQNLLRAAGGNPNLPVDRVLTDEVLDANPFLRGATVGQVISWAGNAMDYGPGQARRMLDAARGGQPTNAMTTGVVPRNAMTPPRTVSEFMDQRDLRQLALDVEKLRGAQAVTQAGAPARVQEAGETTGAQEAARLEARSAATQRQEREKLAAAISELERITRSGGLLERSTGGGLNAIVDRFFDFFNAPTSGAVAIGALQPIADVVTKMVPRFEGPQSNADTQSYREAAGRLADPTVPNETRLAAAREIIRLFRARANQFDTAPDANAAPTGTPSPPRTGQPQTQTPTTFREGQIANGPNGQRIQFRNGQWVPMR